MSHFLGLPDYKWWLTWGCKVVRDFFESFESETGTFRKFRLALFTAHHLSIRHTSLSAGVHSQVALLHELVLMDWYMSKKGKY